MGSPAAPLHHDPSAHGTAEAPVVRADQPRSGRSSCARPAPGSQRPAHRHRNAPPPSRRPGRKDRVEDFASAHRGVTVRAVAADLSTDTGIDTVAGICAAEPLAMLVNNTGVAPYMPLAELPADKARELVHVKVLAPTLLTRAVVAGMRERGEGKIINVAGMIAFSGSADTSVMPRRAVYAGSLAHLVAMSQALSVELDDTGHPLPARVLVRTVLRARSHGPAGRRCSTRPWSAARPDGAAVGDIARDASKSAWTAVRAPAASLRLEVRKHRRTAAASDSVRPHVLPQCGKLRGGRVTVDSRNSAMREWTWRIR
ncbi:SDR family NAD(P)-dependent oxidoreductase [Streptomyces sp. NPDC048438]|uniref:SDR family NAD(P)-dependent oxidoreductase n=1 Tax=Streptomyces sp. NPDC048438 TaxID=3365551 RepID=UPI0037112133